MAVAVGVDVTIIVGVGVSLAAGVGVVLGVSVGMLFVVVTDVVIGVGVDVYIICMGSNMKVADTRRIMMIIPINSTIWFLLIGSSCFVEALFCGSCSVEELFCGGHTSVPSGPNLYCRTLTMPDADS